MKNYEHEFYVTQKCTTMKYYTVIASSMEEAKVKVEDDWDMELQDWEEFDYETVKIEDLIFASTGVIGEEFPVEKIKERLQDLADKLRGDQNKMYWLKILRRRLTQKMGYLLTVPLAPSVVHVKRLTAVCIRLLTPFIRIIRHDYNKGFHSNCANV